MSTSYKNSAWFYDTLSRVVYGRALVNAQVFLLQHIPKDSTVLIIGGGTGWILEELAKICSFGLNITYVEVAPDMMRLSKKRNIGRNDVIFINEAIEAVLLPPDFDVIIAPFLFDNFKQKNFVNLFDHIKSLAKPAALWLVSDFQPTGKWWQNMLLKTMFIFFKMICGIEASRLPDITAQFEKNGFAVKAEQLFFGNFIISRVYKQNLQ